MTISEFFKRFSWLQFFAEDAGTAADSGSAETATGEQTEAGVEADVPGPSLEDLGVPTALAEKHRARANKAAATQAPAAAARQATPQAQTAPEAAVQKPVSMTWDDFMKVPENNAKMQQIVSDRLRRQGKEQEDYMAKLEPGLQIIAAKYGVEVKDGRIDPDALSKAIQDDDSLYEDKALELGVDRATAKHITQLEQEKARAEAEQAKQQRDMELREHFMKMQQAEPAMKQIYPNFDLQRELQNPEFFRLTSPDVGLTVQEAFQALHYQELQQQQNEVVAQKVKAELANSIRSGRSHPRENGGSAVGTTVAGIPDFSKMSSEERRKFIMSARPPK